MELPRLHESVLGIANERIARGDEEPFIIVDVDEAVGKVRAWKELLPRVEPFYAVKAHDDVEILRAFVNAGIGFDCASKAEIDLVLSLGGSADQIIFANPCKPKSHLRFASNNQVRMVTFDNVDELHKIRECMPDAELLLRLLPDDSKAVCRLGTKFGTSLESVPVLLRSARELGLNVVGVAFHVGSGQPDISAFSDGVVLARKAFDIAEENGFELQMLDIGGGYPGHACHSWGDFQQQDLCFPNIARVLRESLDTHFPAESGIRIIAEPGRYMVHSSCVLLANVIARRREVLRIANEELEPEKDNKDLASTPEVTVAVDEKTYLATDHSARVIRYYVNDGLYSSFNNILYDHASVHAVPFNWLLEKTDPAISRSAMDEPLVLASIWGPTCDGLDCIDSRVVHLPELQIGDWLCFPDMGAYTAAAASTFNGFQLTEKIYLHQKRETQ